MAATVNPCGFALLPAYLALFVGDEERRGDAGIGRALMVSATLTIGFVAVFGLFGIAISPLALSIERYLPWATILIGVGLVVTGGLLVADREVALRLPKLGKGGRDGGLGSMFLFGVSYAVASLSCTIGPFLAITSTTLRSESLVSAVAVFVVYALGMGLVVTVLTVAVALAKVGLVGRLRRATPYVSRASGVLLLVAGAYVAWYGWFEVRTLGGGDGQDPGVRGALRVQTWLQNEVIPDRPAVAAMWVAVLTVAVGVFAAARSRRSRGSLAADPMQPCDAPGTLIGPTEQHACGGGDPSPSPRHDPSDTDPTRPRPVEPPDRSPDHQIC
jgi:cytochrome c biogenesis protein CcdA